jgi:hypothetical protein
LLLAFTATVTEIIAAFRAFLTSPEAGHATAAFVIICAPGFVLVVTAPGTATGCFLRDGSSAGATRTVKVLFGPLLSFLFTTAETTAKRLRLIETVVIVIPATPETAGARATADRSWFILEIGRTPGLFRRDAAQSHALVGEEHRGACQQELTELEDRIQPPALEKQNAAAQQTDRREKDVVIAG